MKLKSDRTSIRFIVSFYRGSPPELTELETDADSEQRVTEWAKSVAQERGWRFLEVLPACGNARFQCSYRLKSGACDFSPRLWRVLGGA